MIITTTTALVIINIIAFAVYTYGLIKLLPILRKVEVFKVGHGGEIQIAGQTWEVNGKLVAMITIPFLVYPIIIVTYGWVIYRIVA